MCLLLAALAELGPEAAAGTCLILLLAFFFASDCIEGDHLNLHDAAVCSVVDGLDLVHDPRFDASLVLVLDVREHVRGMKAALGAHAQLVAGAICVLHGHCHVHAFVGVCLAAGDIMQVLHCGSKAGSSTFGFLTGGHVDLVELVSVLALNRLVVNEHAAPWLRDRGASRI